MPLAPEFNLLFLHIPKTGGTTIEKALDIQKPECLFEYKWFYPFEVTPQHLYYREIISLYPKLAALETFAVIRNPYDRLVSEYYHTRNGENKRTAKVFGTLTFSQFVTKALSLPQDFRMSLFDRHLEPQVNFIEGCSDPILFRFEQIEDCFAYLRTKTGKDLQFGHERKSVDRKRYKTYYTQNTIKKVKDFYQKDLDRFGYTF